MVPPLAETLRSWSFSSKQGALEGRRDDTVGEKEGGDGQGGK